jgi:hypothetical protein
MISKKLFKRIAAIGLSAILALSAPVTSFAAEVTDDSAILTVAGDDESSFDEKEITAPDETADEAEYDAQDEAEPEEIEDGEESEEAGSDDEYEDDTETESEETDAEEEVVEEDPEAVSDEESTALLDTGVVEISTWEELAGVCMRSGHYKLVDDLKYKDAWQYIPVSGSVTVDLNGHVIEGCSDRAVFDVGYTSSLTIMDSDPYSEHKNDDESTKYTYRLPDSDTEIAITGGIITGGASAVKAGKTFTMNGGTIYGNSGYDAYTGGVILAVKTDFYFNGGAIINNDAGNTHVGGGGVSITSAEATMHMAGGKIIGNTADFGGGIWSKGTVIITGGEIIGNHATEAAAGGGIYWEDTDYGNGSALSLNGKVIIKDNDCGDGDDSNICFGASDESRITISGQLDPESQIGVGYSGNIDEYRIITEGGSDFEIPEGVFFSDDNGRYVDMVGNELALFDNAPAVTGESVWRTDAENAAIKFCSDSAGTYYYLVTDSLVAPESEYVKEHKDGTGEASAGMNKINSVSGLSAGERYVYIVVEDEFGRLSDVHTIGMPCDAYYHEDFESYPEGTTIAGGDLSPWWQKYDGRGSEYQRVIDSDKGKILQIESSRGQYAWGTDHLVDLPLSMRDVNSDWIFESDICAPDSHVGNQLYLFIAEFDNNANGIHINGDTIYDAKGPAGQRLADITAGEWYHVTIHAYPYLNVYDVYLDGEMIGAGIKGNLAHATQLWISPGNRGNTAGIYMAQYDNMQYYTVPASFDAVSTLEELNNKLADDSVAEIVVANEIEIPDGTSIDGRGKTVSVLYPFVDEDGALAKFSSGYRVFKVPSNANVSISNMTIMGGGGSGAVGAIYGGSRSFITLDNVTLTRSQTGLLTENNSKALLKDCIVYRNVSGTETNAAGGLRIGSSYDAGCVCVLDNCSVTENRGRGEYGAGAVMASGKLYVNNTVITNNSAVGATSAIGSFRGENVVSLKTYMMNSTITGNISKFISAGLGGNSAVYLAGERDKLLAVNSIITDNYRDDGTSVRRLDVSNFRSDGGVFFRNCVYGEILPEARDIDESCQDIEYRTAGSYVYDSVRLGSDDYSSLFMYPDISEKTAGCHDYYVPVVSSGPAADGGTATYFSYTDDLNSVFMGYYDGSKITGLEDLTAPDESAKVTSYYEGTARDEGVIGASASEDAPTQAPVIKGANVWRADAADALVKFKSSASGRYYYKVTDSETAPAAKDIKLGSTGRGTVTAGLNTISCKDITTGNHYVHIVVENKGLMSNVITVDIPYDVYYYEGFDIYDEGTYVNAPGQPLWPLYQTLSGNGDENQCVIDLHNAIGTVLQMQASGGNVSEQRIDISEMVDRSREWVLEVSMHVEHPYRGDEILISLSGEDGTDIGIVANYNKLYYGRVSEETRIMNFFEPDSWDGLVLKVHPKDNTCDVIFTGFVLAEGLPADTSNIDSIRISTCDPPINYHEIRIDDIKYYYAPTWSVTFDSDGGSAVSAQTVNDSEKAIKPADPEKDGCIFDGWFLNDERYDFATPVTGDLQLKAHWVQSINPVVVIEGWTYGDTPNAPYITEGSNPGGGTVKYEYKVKDADDATYTETVPTQVDDYTVRATVSATSQYQEGTATADFSIAKAVHADVKIKDTVLNKIATTKKELQLPALSEGQSYKGDSITIGGAVPQLIVENSPALEGTLLIYSTTAQNPGAEATITIPVAGGNNYYDYSLIVTVSTDGVLVKFSDDVDPDNLVYTGEKLMPEVEVYKNGELMTKGVDYTVTYSGNINVAYDKKTGAVIAGGKATVKGKGNLSDSKVLTFTIQPKSLGDEHGKDPEIEVGTINIAVGQKATVPVITYGSKKLAAKDFTVTDPMGGKPYTTAGDNELTVTGKGNYAGTVKVPVHVKETKAELKKFAVAVDTKTAVYFDPFATEAEMQAKLAALITVYDSADKSKTPLEGGYIITYPSDVLSAGKKTITIVGTGQYSGNVSKAITVKPLVVKAGSGNVSINVNQEEISKKNYYFVAGGVTLGDDLEVKCVSANGSMAEKLTEGTDYKVTYTNNKAVSKEGKPAEYSITFLGNYKGTPAIKNTKTAKVNVFTILAKEISKGGGMPADDFDVYTPDVAYTGKAGTYYSVPVVTQNGSTLAASNYTVKYFVKEDGEYREITSKNKLTLPEGVDKVNIAVVIEAKGNYSGRLVLMDQGSYDVIRQKADKVYDLSKARITIYGAGYNPANKSNKKLSSIPFNGYPRYVTDIDPETNEKYGTIVVDYKIGKNYVVLEEGKDYDVEYRNNINKGKAMIIINGTNDTRNEMAFAGSKRTTLSITTFSLKKLLSSLFGG